MLEVQDDLLWIGHAGDIRQPRLLFDVGIVAIVDLAYEEFVAELPRQLIYCRFPINDGGGNRPSVLRQAVQCVVDLLASGTQTLVACSAGMSRSPTIAAFALAAHLSQSPDHALDHIVNRKPCDINRTLWNDVATIFSNVRHPTPRMD